MKIEMYIELSDDRQISLISNDKPNRPRYRNSCIRFHKKGELPDLTYQTYMTGLQAIYLFSLIQKSLHSGNLKFENNEKII